MTKRARTDEVTAKLFGSDLLCWYRAETMSAKFGNGQAVTHILDESGNGAHMTNAAAGASAAPVMVTDGVNGYASILFDGTNDELRGGFVSGSVVKACWAVVKQTATGNWDQNSGFLTGLTAGDAGIGGTSGSLNLSTQHAGTETWYVNGANTQAVTDAGVWNLVYYDNATADTFNSIIMGRFQSTAGYFAGEIAECGALTEVPAADIRNAFFNALIARYKITG